MKALLVKLPEELSRYVLLVLNIRWPGMMSVHAGEAGEAAGLIHSERPDLVFLYLPERSTGSEPEECFQLIGEISSFCEVPLVVIGASDDVTDKIKALETGADDWVSRDFVPMEFIAKVNAILRRRYPNKQGVASLYGGRLSIDYDARQVYISGNPVNLTPTQYDILCHLARNVGRVCTNTELLQHIWGPNYADEKEILKLSVHRLRSRIEKDPSSPEIILNERGIGYVIRASGRSQ
jgi:DNA-binding response OmpR family regulator